MKKLFNTLFLLGFVLSYGQSTDYFAELNSPATLGDARYLSMSGAMVSMSGSLTALSLNPAGAALYNHDVFSMTLGQFNARNFKTENNYPLRGTSNLNVGNFGFLGYDQASRLKIFFTYNSDQVYRERINYSGTGNSIQLPWIANSALTAPDYLPNIGVYEDLLYQSYATDWDENSNEYRSTADLTNVEFEHDFFRRGMRNRWTLGAGYSINNNLSVGASAAIVHSFETVDVVHTESYPVTTDLQGFTLDEWWNNNAIGLAINAGVLYRPVHQLRLGAAIELPHVYAFMQDWEIEFTSNRPSISNNIAQNAYGTDYQWTYISAPKARFGATYLFGRSGLISTSYTATPHQWGMTPNSDLSGINSASDSLLSTEHRVAVGGEWRFGPISIRGGGAYIPQYYQMGSAQVQRSMGLAFKERDFTLDLGWTAIDRARGYFPFSAQYAEELELVRSLKMLMITATWRL
ncbi:MAG: hypothetical protein RL754_555 [Bacteroidota bacterium]